MMIDTMDERGFCRADKRWMEPTKCYFPLFDFIKPLPGRWMCLAYAFMFSGVLGMLTGFQYRTSCAMYAISYWYIFLADKTSWNNHSYLFGLLIVIFSVTDAHRNWSADSWQRRKIASEESSLVPRWNYLLLRIQFFIMYFVAGLKKFEPDWLRGYSVMSLGRHHVFTPFRYVFSAEFVDHWIVHVGGFVIDLFSGFGLCFRFTRPLTTVVLLAFHSMNAMMFTIGMFPYVCAAMLPVFFNPSVTSKVLRDFAGIGRNDSQKPMLAVYKLPTRTKQNAITACLCAYTILQLFLPYSHFITQGYNGWRNGLYGYSWDMMVYNIDVAKIQVKVVDHARREYFFLDPHSWTDNVKWALHGDMLPQFAECVATNMPDRSANMSVRMDVWGSLNGRFHQRLVDPKADLLHAHWSPWSPAPWLMPLMQHLDRWRPWIVDTKRKTNENLLFFADFPGMTVTNDDYMPNATATTLAVLEGAVAVRELRDDGGEPVRLVSGEAVEVTGRHAVTTVSATPSCSVYAAESTDADTEDGHRGGGVDSRPGCSDACYAFAFDAIKAAFSAIFRI
ncbi:vitamin K-dependent gamma-carboxylase isoform X2 [Sipha flava]|nr:vitamin K-dependent gamma-carboxylase isoform X2 [Sipha flava]